MPEPQKLIHEILPVGTLHCNCHIVGDPQTREAIVIDPGDDAARIWEVIKRHRLKVTAIVVTHTHIDHVIGLRRVQAATGAPVCIHADDLPLYRALDIQASWLGWQTPEAVKIDQFVHEGDVIRWGPYQAQILHTPGHTPGSICLYMPSDVPAGPAEARAAKSAEVGTGQLFAGDTLFAGSIGRTDLWGGSFEGIIRSLKGKLLDLPDSTIVYPGHGAATTIGEERATNPFLAGN
ncbi:MAG TPA: MBL fold metallo-hydrolase [Candidatus Acidoferrales bacterium]|jgi:glyoxylase-like metal-dependent hydrolase (beta-lactamase superfamily II)|nr:MBL fold metallo-hydrolase [Candidatus Acidoferrales bacterium]